MSAPNHVGSATPAQIRDEAERANRFVVVTVADAQNRADELGGAVTISEVVSKVGQYLGGAGAIVFGLNEAGRNAAYAGAVAGLATLLEQIVEPTEKSEHRATCLALANMKVELETITGSWRLRATDSTFRAGFLSERRDFYDRVSERYDRCNR